MDTESQLELVVVVISLIAGLLASSAETALTSVSRIRVRHLSQEGRAWARKVERLHQDPNTFLSTILVTNTVAIIVASVAAATFAERHGHLNPVLVSLVLSVVILIFAELTPKTFAVAHAEKVARVVTGPVIWLATAFRPVVWLLGGITTLVLRPMRGAPAVKGPFVNEEELRMLLNLSEEQGVLEEEEAERIQNIFEIGDMLVREVMVPRTDITAVEAGATKEQILKQIIEHGHTRIPVFDGTIDHIVGVIHAKALLRYMARERRTAFDARQLSRPPYYTPETKKVDELLHEMQARKVHMAVVVDEYGGTAGICTIEDILEEIVGEIMDEYDTAEESDVDYVTDHEVVINARMSIDEVNEILKTEFESDHYDTLGGFLISELGHIPHVGDVLDLGELRLVVESVTGQRVGKVRVHAAQPITPRGNANGNGNGHEDGQGPGQTEAGPPGPTGGSPLVSEA